MLGMRVRKAAGVAVIGALLLVGAPQAAHGQDAAPLITQDLRFRASDGVEILVRLGGRGPLVDGNLPPRPVIAEFTPYGPGCCPEHGGPAYNHLQVHIRGTGDSDGSFDALGPRSQRDLAEIVRWACDQPWSNGRLGLWGFSASAIVVYNSLHQDLACLDAAVLGSGTHELYRDLLYPGGIPNGVPALGVFGLIGAPALALLPDRLARAPLSLAPFSQGMAQTAVDYLLHPTLDQWWQQRGMRGDANRVPVLMINGFFDVESRGAFQAFQALRENGSRLYVVGAHDGVPAGTPGPVGVTRRWFDRHLRDVDNGVDREPPAELWLADGDRARMLAGEHVHVEGDDWPIPGTEWVPLHLRAERGGGSGALNDGTLGLEPEPRPTTQPYVPIPSLFTATDPHTTSLLGVFDGAAPLTLMNGFEVLGLSYTTEPFAQDVLLAGPANLELALTSTSIESDLWVVVSDVWPDGSAHPMATGRLRTSFPDLVPDRSLLDGGGNVVQPLNDLSAKRHVAPGTEHRYHVELWPIGNRFKAGHRLRLHVVGASSNHLPTLTGANLVRLGGADGGSVLRVPVLPGSDLRAALGHEEPVEPGDGAVRPAPPSRPEPPRPPDPGPPGAISPPHAAGSAAAPPARRGHDAAPPTATQPISSSAEGSGRPGAASAAAVALAVALMVIVGATTARWRTPSGSR